MHFHIRITLKIHVFFVIKSTHILLYFHFHLSHKIYHYYYPMIFHLPILNKFNFISLTSNLNCSSFIIVNVLVSINVNKSFFFIFNIKFLLYFPLQLSENLDSNLCLYSLLMFVFYSHMNLLFIS